MQTLDQIVREYMIEVGDSTEHKYPKYLLYGINALKDINMDISGIPKTVSLEIKDDLTVDLPTDYLNYVMIGACNSRGEVQSLGRNDKLCLANSTDECGNPTINKEKKVGYGISNTIGYLGSNNVSQGLTTNFRNGEFIGRFYGAGGGNNVLGEYRIDSQNHRIQLSSDTSVKNILLEYISDYSLGDGSFMVHPFIVEAVKSYIAWKYLERKFLPSGSYRAEYFNERRRALRRYGSRNISEVMQSLRKGFKMSPKL